MNNGWPMVTLGELLSKSEDWITLDPTQSYREVTVRLWGKGVTVRREALGSEIKSDKRLRVQQGQFILSRIDARNGAFGLVPGNLDGAVVSNDFPTFNVVVARLLPEFLGWMCRTAMFVDLCKAASEGTTNRVRLKEERFLRTPIPLPPLPEQRRIVAKIEQLAARIYEVRTLRQQAAEEADTLVRSCASNVIASQTTWGTVRNTVLDKKGAVRSGPFGSQLLHEEFVAAGVPAIGTRDVQTNRFNLHGGWFVTQKKFEQFQRYKVFPGDLLATIVGASIGRFCVVPDDVPTAFTTKHIQALTLNRQIVDPAFASFMLNFHVRCRGSLFSQVEGSAQPSLNADKILHTEFPLTPISEQHRIVEYLNGLQAKVDALKALQAQTAAELDALLPSILDRAFKGEL